MGMICFEHVTKLFGEAGLSDFSLEIREGELLVLLGRSGSGKTTALRLINRLIDPSSGRILVAGKDISEQNPIVLRRSIGYAIQHIGLFPHMTVEENIAIVPRLLKWPKDQLEARLEEMFKLIGLDRQIYGPRFPGALSGGQKQRIGVARALAADPPIVLMDEPFGALDPITREELQHELLEIQSRLHKTIVFVTHDIMEAIRLGDRVAVLEEGHLAQIGTPEELLQHPATSLVEQLFGKNALCFFMMKKSIDELRYLINPATPSQVDETHSLKLNYSLMDALFAFKRSRKLVLPVFDQGKYLGQIRKEEMLRSIC